MMFGKKGYLIEKYSVAENKKSAVWHLTMRDDNMVLVTEGYNIVGGRVHMGVDEANSLFAKSCHDLGIGEEVK